MNQLQRPFFCGVIEGFYGRQWSWSFRKALIQNLPKMGFSSYIFAPKGERLLRSDWHQPFSGDLLEQLRQLGDVAQQAGVEWGVGLSPYGTQECYNAVDRAALIEKVRQLNLLGCNALIILFDDMTVSKNGLVERQSAVIADVLDHSEAAHLMMCPTYYSSDPVLDKIFGDRPDDYLNQLGLKVPASVDILWTGPEVISTEIPLDHIAWLAKQLGRPPVIWDNYWANDGRKTNNFLPLKALGGRSRKLAQQCAGHLFNPMNQPHIAELVLTVASALYNDDAEYDAGAVLNNVLGKACDQPLKQMIESDYGLFTKIGLADMADERQQQLIQHYGSLASPIARDITDWLNGEYTFDPSCLTG